MMKFIMKPRMNLFQRVEKKMYFFSFALFACLHQSYDSLLLFLLIKKKLFSCRQFNCIKDTQNRSSFNFCIRPNKVCRSRRIKQFPIFSPFKFKMKKNIEKYIFHLPHCHSLVVLISLKLQIK